MVATLCPACGKTYQLKDELIGRTAKCKCGSTFKVVSGAGPVVTPSISFEAAKERPESSAVSSHAESGAEKTKSSIQPNSAVNRICRKHRRRIALIGGPVALVILVGLIVGQRIIADRRQKVEAANEAMYRRQMRNAGAIREQAAQANREAEDLRRRAAEIRAQSAADASSVTTARRMTKSEAIEQDERIQMLLDKYPEFRSMLLSPSQEQLDIRLNLLIATGHLSMADVRYVRAFAKALHDLPNY